MCTSIPLNSKDNKNSKCSDSNNNENNNNSNNNVENWKQSTNDRTTEIDRVSYSDETIMMDSLILTSSSDTTSCSKSIKSTKTTTIPNSSSLFDKITRKINYLNPRTKSILCMTGAMSMYFAGHEFARSAIQSMYSSKELGFDSSAALPLAVGLVSPFSIFLLWCFTRSFNTHGPKYALIRSTITSAIIIFCTSLMLYYIKHNKSSTPQSNPTVESSYNPSYSIQSIISKSLLLLVFVYQSANVQLLTTQHWSFLGSIMNEEEGKLWFAPIAGMSSITSTIAAAYVSALVNAVGLIGLLSCASITIALSCVFAYYAYDIAIQYGFEPNDRKRDNSSGSSSSTNNKDSKLHPPKGNTRNDKITNESRSDSVKTRKSKQQRKHQQQRSEKSKHKNMIQTARELFHRVPILSTLFQEVMLSQCFSSTLNFLFLVKVRNSITEDTQRAGWTGHCYAWINGISGLLQFFIIPLLTKIIDPRWFWSFMPIVMFVLTTYQNINQSHFESGISLPLLTFTFSSLKTMEYSIRGVCSEMLYVTLDYESKFLGKEVINLFANRFGKSAIAVILFLFTSLWGRNDDWLLRYLPYGCNVFALLWLYASVRLTTSLRSKAKLE